MTSITDNGAATSAAPSMLVPGAVSLAIGEETISLMESEPSVEDLDHRRNKLAADLDAAVRRELAKIVKSPFDD